MKNLLLVAGCLLTFSVSQLPVSALNHAGSNKTALRPDRDDCSKCEKAAEDAYNFSRQAEESGNFESIRKFAEEAKNAFEDAEKYAEKCGCGKAESEAGKGYKAAKKATKAENLQEAGEYAREARKSADDLRILARKCSRN